MNESTRMVFTNKHDPKKNTSIKNHKHPGVYYMIIGEEEDTPDGYRDALEVAVKKVSKKKAKKKAS